MITVSGESMGRLLQSVVLASAILFPGMVNAQQQQPASPPPSEWAKMPRMQLERQFAGPLQDTIVQRWRDPVDGVVCYIYLPVTAAHSTPMQSGYVQYGANTIGSISCMPAPPPANTAAGAKR
jgi:hypothetical protein